ncbi:MAG TPA: TauD/TfdA family dioxygenase [Longimicrobiales bacterium]|nr:TauD/TfdA family dioxygenase [Longimicrobiales bacterium]
MSTVTDVVSGMNGPEKLAGGSLVRTYQVSPEQRLPLVVEPVVEGLSLAEWCGANRDWIEDRLMVHGGVLFRNFEVPTPADFEKAARATWGELFADYGDLPRNSAGEKIYESTPYPPDQMILWHNESAHLPSWPMRINFHCVQPAPKGGCTPVIDTRGLMHQLDAAVVEAFRTKGLLYVRNFSAGIDPTWEEFFHTSDRAKVEEMCRAAGSEYEWRPDGGLRIMTRTPGVVKHPKTGEDLFFNQVQLHHIYCVDEETREGLRALFDDDELPRNVYYGDGTPIPDEVMEHIGEVFERVCVRFQWQKGDTIFLDNMLVSHARDTYEGPRKIVVALAQMMTADRLPA